MVNVGDLVAEEEWQTSKRDEKATIEKKRLVHDNGSALAWSVLSLEHRASGTGRATETRRQSWAKQNTSEYAQGILLEVYERLGQMSAVSGWSVQQHATLNNGDSPFMMLTGRERE